jgi:ferredoxin-nitrite reductase
MGSQPNASLETSLALSPWTWTPLRPTKSMAIERQTFSRRRVVRDPTVPGDSDGRAQVVAGELRLDPATLEACLGRHPLKLTVQEFDLLLVLAQSAGKPVSQEELARHLWGEVTPERRRHLSVLVARLRVKLAGSKLYKLRTLRKRGYGLMLPPANRIEELKLAKDGLDVLDDILRYARTGEEIDPDDIERMKWYGVFYRRQTPGFFMFRLRIPNGILTSAQAIEIGRLSNRFGRGRLDITTRQNIQLRWVRIQDVPRIFESLQSVGLEYRQSGMDNVRNITGCPMAGLDPDEAFDASPIAAAVQEAIVGRKEFSNLPRKFNISVSGCRNDCATSQVHDLSLTPALKEGRPGFNVSAGGMGGETPAFASGLDVFVEPANAAALCIAAVELFRDSGHREDRRRGRLRWLLDEWGLERLRRELERRFGPLERAGESQIEHFGGDHIGVSAQKQPGMSAVGCLVPVGRLTGDDLIEFGRLADACGSGELRLTNNQNVLIVNVPRSCVAGLLREPLLEKHSPFPSSWTRRMVSCTGRDYCHFALIDTKGSALEFARRMDDVMPLDAPLRVHWSGCQRGCGQHHVGDIGLRASRLNTGREVIEAADVFIGGRLGPDPRLATPVLEAVPLDELPQRVAELLTQGTGDKGQDQGNAHS